MALSDLLKDLDPKLANALSEVTAGLRREFDEKLSATRAELGLEAAPAESREEAPPPEPAPAAEMLDPIAELKHAVTAIDSAGSQGEVLSALVAGCSRFASRAAVFLVREGSASGWNSHGFSLSDDEMRGVSLAVDPGSVWQRLTEGEGTFALAAGECAAVTDALGGEAPEMGLLLPFVLNNQTAAGVYCDRLAGEPPPNVAALQLVTFIASQVLENLPVRDRSSTSTLRLAAAAAAPAPTPSPTPTPEPAPEAIETEAPPVEDTVEDLGAVDVSSQLGAPATQEPASPDRFFEGEPPSAIEAEPPSAIEAEPPLAIEVEQPSAIETEQPPAIEAEPPPAAEAGPAPAAELGPPTDDGLAAAMPESPAVGVEPEPTVETPVAAEPSADLDAEPTAPALLSDATTQVVPPSDLEGPGWAFAGASSATPESGDEAQHEEARRLARLLVTEVKLYNEELVEQGRQKGNLYSVLKEDIDRSRQIFEDRIAEDVRSHSDYFHEALVRILAGGDPNVLGA